MRSRNQFIRLKQIESFISKSPNPKNRRKAFTFLLPRGLFAHFEFLKKNRTCSELLSDLINKYYESVFSGRLWSNEKISKQYQEEGLDLVRIGMKVSEGDLVELSLLADYLGVSRCFLFSKLLELDLMGWGEKVAEIGWVRSLTSNPRITLLHLSHYPKYKLKMTYLY
ncbi:DUF1564 family protein [Leptospira ilyithenensis]|uniref:DUF1564 family protein n=1 Tax=Leptospira ilyithenensis TaxID=2484901 RepID=A0A4R9LJS2_9LEPT|nr:DUF1564 family protein [Leptospira ilyithenensis]